jgi:hypothetical protein
LAHFSFATLVTTLIVARVGITIKEAATIINILVDCRPLIVSQLIGSISSQLGDCNDTV